MEQTIHIPGWRIIRVIGKGSFGKVYEVEKEDEFGGGVRSALKVISIPETSAEIEAYRDDGYDDESITKLFRSRVEDITSEFRLMNRLKGCSNIVSYEDHTVMQHENDIGYDIMIRMELLTPLPKYMDQQAGKGAADENTVRRLGADICRALELCERCHIIHRDIKPQNIFVSDLGDFKLGDFGIAKTSDHTTKATKTGTYAYMAPEVYLSKPYNASVDLYSLGIVLYWMLNERRGPFLPLPPEIPTPAQTAEALERRMHGEPLPAPKHGSEELKQIVLKACSYDPKDRYASPAQMRRDLERALTASAAELPAEQTLAFEEAGEATVGLFAGKEVPIRDENATVRLFEDRKETPKPVPAKKKPEKAVKPAAYTETVAEQEPQQQKKRQKKNVLAVILAAAMLVIAAAIVLVIALSGRTGAAQETEAEAVPTLAPTEEPTEAPADEITVAVTPEPEKTPEPVSEEELAYSAALTLFEEGKYEEAIAAFEALNGYRDSAEQIETCKNERDYTAAVALYDSGEYKKAIPELIKIRDYKDSNTYLLACWDHVAERKTIDLGYSHIFGVRKDGSVLVKQYVKNKQYNKGQGEVSDWTDIIAISASEYFTVGLKADGTVVAVGDNQFGQCDVGDWTDIVGIDTGFYHTVGLRADGTVVTAGSNAFEQCNTTDWTDIITVKTKGCCTVGLKMDGTVVAAGYLGNERTDGPDWTDIVDVDLSSNHIVGLKTDGTVVAAGRNSADGECNVTDWRWTDIVMIKAADGCTVGLKADGTVVATGYYDELYTWSNIVSIAADLDIAGLKSDGTVVAEVSGLHGECTVAEWTDIVMIDAYDAIIVGMKSDGTVVLSGKDAHLGSKIDISDWSDIMLPNEGHRVPGPISAPEPAPEATATPTATATATPKATKKPTPTPTPTPNPGPFTVTLSNCSFSKGGTAGGSITVPAGTEVTVYAQHSFEYPSADATGHYMEFSINGVSKRIDNYYDSDWIPYYTPGHENGEGMFIAYWKVSFVVTEDTTVTCEMHSKYF